MDEDEDEEEGEGEGEEEEEEEEEKEKEEEEEEKEKEKEKEKNKNKEKNKKKDITLFNANFTIGLDHWYIMEINDRLTERKMCFTYILLQAALNALHQGSSSLVEVILACSVFYL